MSCEVEQELTAYLDGELAPFQAKQVETHLATCQACRETEDLLQRTVAQLSHLPSFEPSVALRRAVLGRIDREPAGLVASWQRWFRPQLLIPSMGLVAAAVVALVWVKEPHLDAADMGQYELAANLEIAEAYEVVGVNSADDLEVVQHLHELEVQP